MSSVSSTQAQREIDSLRQYIKEREEQHADELSKIKARDRERLQDLSADHHDDLQELGDRNRENAELQKEDYNTELERITEDYEGKLHQTRKDHYDRFGKLATESARKLEQERDTRKQQLSDLISANESVKTLNEEFKDNQMQRLRSHYETEKQDMEHYVDQKLNEQRSANAEALSNMAYEKRKHIDKAVDANQEELFKQKLGNELKYKMLADQSEAERQARQKSFEGRERQLIDGKEFVEKSAVLDGQKAIEDYRKRSNENYVKLINQLNFDNAKKQQEHTAQMERTNIDHQNREQDMRRQFRHAENLLRLENEGLKTKDEFNNDMVERRHKQELHLANQALSRTHESSAAEMKDRFKETLHDEIERNQRHHRQQTDAANQNLNRVAQAAMEDKKRLEYEKNQIVSKLMEEKDRSRDILVNQYEERAKASDAQGERQVDEVQSQASQKVRKAVTDSELKVYTANRENQLRTFRERDVFQNQFEELQQMHEGQRDAVEDSYLSRSRRMKDGYYQSLDKQQKHFDETTDEYKYESQLEMAKLRNNAEYERRMQLIELQGKNRLMSQNYESKITRLIDEHQDDVEKVKMGYEKQLRDLVKKNRELMDTERELHQRELVSKENQLNEKMKAQKDSFQDQIEKLKRTHELRIKKG